MDTVKSAIKPVKAAAEDVLFVCQKCEGGKQLRRSLKDAIKESGRKREVRVVASGCMDVCPKHTVTLARAAAGKPVRYLVVRSDAALDEILND
ncbi:MAG: hypothetical protein NVSMB5_13740 [Candidatus Velthaea sp.]